MEQSKIRFRPIREEDRAFLVRVYGSTREEELSMTGWSREEKDAFISQQFHAQHTHYTEYFREADYHVILIDGKKAGRLYIQQKEDEIRIVDIALLPEFRGQGAGRKMLENILQQGKDTGLPVRIHVEQYNRALSLYHCLGFKKIEQTGIYYLMEKTPGTLKKTEN